MLRSLLYAVSAVVALAALVEDAHAGQHHRGGVVDYVFGGYGPGPFGRGDINYLGYTSHTVVRHREFVPSFTTRVPYRLGR